MRKKILFCFLLFNIISCFSINQKQGMTNQFISFFGITPLEKQNLIKNLEGDFQEVSPFYMSSGYFTYTASSEWVYYLLNNNSFPTQSEFNTQFYKTLIGSDFKNYDLEFYTNHTQDTLNVYDFTLNNKIYITGTFYPYHHQILYDTITHKAIHLVSGIRD